VPDQVVFDEKSAVAFKDIKKEKDIGPVVTQNIIVSVWVICKSLINYD